MEVEGEKIRILLIEDNPGDARLIRELLAAKESALFDLEHADRLSTGLSRLAQGNVDVILLDLSLPDSHGLDGLNKICAQAPKVPVVVLSGLSDEAVTIKAVQEGAQDYLVKGSINRDLLVCSLRYAIERQHLRTALRESEARYRLFSDSVADVIWAADAEARITYVSPSIRRFLGYTVEETLKLKISDILTPDSTEQARRFVKWQMKTFARGVQYPPASMTLEHVRNDGSTVWAEVMLSFMQDENGNVTRIMGVTRDITERKKAEEALRESETRFRTVFEGASLGIALVDFSAKTLSMNHAFERMLGYSLEEFRQLESNLKYLHPDDAMMDAKLYIEMVKGEREHYTVDKRYIRNDGEVIWGRQNLSVVRDANGKPQYFIAMVEDITERKKAEEALRRSEEYFKALTEDASEAIAVIDSNGIVRYESMSLARILGYKPEELISGNVFELIHPDDIQKATEVFTKLMQTPDAAVEAEVRYKHKDGSWHHILGAGKNLLNNPAVSGIVVNYRDISERKHMEEALQTSERQYRLLAENVKDVIWTVDMNLRLTYTSPSITQLTGYRREEYMTKTLGEILTPASVKFVTNLFTEELALEESGHSDLFRARTFEAELICKDGSTVPVEMKATGIRDADGRPIGLLGVSRDISDRKSAEEALRQREKDYSILLESTHEGIIVVDAETLKVVFSNRHAALMFGFDPVLNDALGANILDFVYPEDREMVVKGFVEDLYQRERRQRYDVRVKTKDAREIWVSALGTRVEFQGRAAALLSLRDVTKEKRMEDEKQKMEEELLLAGRLAAVGELAAGVAHELNNPLAAIQGFAQLLTKSNDSSEATKKDLDTIYREAQRAARITQDLLSFARKHKPERQIISINEALEKTLELRVHQMKVNNIELSVQLQPDVPLTMADFYQMQQVFMNIILNAEQAMIEAHGRGRLLVKTRAVDGVIQMTFIDNGPGIPKENLERIFDPFFTTKEVGKGTGLGLSVCYGIIQAHGGRIYAKSEPGKGATFVVEIPIITQDAPIAKSR
jgi:two-component system NtrC family sensor kinase